jgi:lipoprotein-releasing system ATP-binding protein
MQFNDVGRIIEVFHNLSLDVAHGSSLAVVGESGVGKTTLLHILGMLERPLQGGVWFDDCDVWKELDTDKKRANFRGKCIGFVFQAHYLLPEFDALENVAIPQLIQGVSRSSAYADAKALLERVGLEHRLTHRPGALSGGEQQRVAIARGLSASPGVILADEPTGNLDQKTGREVMDLLLNIQREEQKTLLVVTHSTELAQLMDRRVELTPKGIVELN